MKPRTRCVRAALVTGTLVICGACDFTGSPSRTPTGEEWPVDSLPALRLGAAENDTVQLFATVLGATMLPDGSILVADRDDMTLHLFRRDGSRIRSLARRGSGPGEFNYPADFWRCGDRVYIYDIDGYSTSVFDLSGTFERDFPFGRGAQQPGSSTPYRTACNERGVFAHYGWENLRERNFSGTVYRPKVPFWLGGADSVVTAVLDSFPGSERFLQLSADGELRGTMPRIFGRQTSIALSSDRLYIGAAERAELLAVNLADLSIDTIPLPVTGAPVTAEDIASELAVRLAVAPPDRRRGVESDFETHAFPDSMPPYAAIVVDSRGMLWVQDFPKAADRLVRWLVLSADGAVVAHARLPNHFEVYEIGDDYILGRYLHPVEAIPQVHLYGFRRDNAG